MFASDYLDLHLVVVTTQHSHAQIHLDLCGRGYIEDTYIRHRPAFPVLVQHSTNAVFPPTHNRNQLAIKHAE